MIRGLALLYGVACYLLTGAVVVYAAGFVADAWVPKSASGGGEATTVAILVDLSLIALFGLQHSVMARAEFKRLWTQLVPTPIERSTYVLASDLAFIVLFVLWQPLPGVVWRFESVIIQVPIWALAIFGIILMSLATFQIDHADLFGLRQLWVYFRGRAPSELSFQVPTLYRISRHPMMLGMLIALWVTPEMTVGRLVFCAGMTAYIFVGLRFEERDLRQRFGSDYERYAQRAPMLIGIPTRGER